MRKKKSNKKVKDYSDTILLIVENSEVEFFKQYFNQFLYKNYSIKSLQFFVDKLKSL
jgi:hypothetical protein